MPSLHRNLKVPKYTISLNGSIVSGTFFFFLKIHRSFWELKSNTRSLGNNRNTSCMKIYPEKIVRDLALWKFNAEDVETGLSS
jgi:hypothetical protein